MQTAEGPVQRQLDAYNARNLESFLAEYSDDVAVYRPPAAEPTIVGKQALGAHYAKNRFNLPALHARLLNRIVSGDIVVDQEDVTATGTLALPNPIRTSWHPSRALRSSSGCVATPLWHIDAVRSWRAPLSLLIPSSPEGGRCPCHLGQKPSF